jgi:SAM-dependent methyltransferase
VSTSPAPGDRANTNLQRFDAEADHPEFGDVALKPAERNALALLADSIAELDMLDLGVGAGRTAYTFAPLVRRYVGLDYSPRLIEHARRRIGETGRISFTTGDARDLAPLKEDPEYRGFDFVLFSFSGIDAVDHEGRLKVLAEVRDVIKPNGLFLFSSHSTGALPLTLRRPIPDAMRGSRVYRLVSPLAAYRYRRAAEAANEEIDFSAVRENGWAIVRDPAFDFSLDVYYIDPERQVEQLRDAGFSVEAVYNMAGESVELPYSGADPWLDYLCRPS